VLSFTLLPLSFIQVITLTRTSLAFVYPRSTHRSKSGGPPHGNGGIDLCTAGSSAVHTNRTRRTGRSPSPSVPCTREVSGADPSSTLGVRVWWRIALLFHPVSWVRNSGAWLAYLSLFLNESWSRVFTLNQFLLLLLSVSSLDPAHLGKYLVLDQSAYAQAQRANEHPV
jgi:hypothetical protein